MSPGFLAVRAARISGAASGLLSVALLLAPDGARAAEANPIHPTLLERYEPRVFTNAAGSRLNYRLFKPAPPDAANGALPPLVIFLHGAAGLGDDNARQFNGGNEVPPLALIAPEAQQRFPCFVLAPQCPRGESWSSTGSRPAPALQRTLEALQGLQREFRIDSRRVYVVGVSMGGRGVYEALRRFPGVFAAAVPICAAGDADWAGKFKQVPIWCFHGGADTTVPVAYAHRMMAALRLLGASPKYTEYAGVGHDSYRNAFREPELLPWLFSQRLAL